MERGYLNSSPFDALILAIIIKIIFSVPSIIMIGIPITIRHRGTARIMYNNMDI